MKHSLPAEFDGLCDGDPRFVYPLGSTNHFGIWDDGRSFAAMSYAEGLLAQQVTEDDVPTPSCMALPFDIVDAGRYDLQLSAHLYEAGVFAVTPSRILGRRYGLVTR